MDLQYFIIVDYFKIDYDNADMLNWYSDKI